MKTTRSPPKKIAPMLDDMIESYAHMGFGYYPKRARAELRALLAVARASRRMMRARSPGGGGAWVQPFGIELARALARLDRMSEGKP